MNKKYFFLFFIVLFIFTILLIKLALAASFTIDSLNLEEKVPQTNPPKAYFKVGLKKAWETVNNLILNPSPVVIGIVDTGIDIQHPEFIGVDFGNTPLDAKSDVGTLINGTLESHGTNVAGIIGANNISSTSPDNYVFPHINGVLSGVRNLNYKLENRKFSGNIGIVTLFSAGKKIFEAANNGAKIINLSISTWNPLGAVIFNTSFFVHSDVLFVVAAGNNNLLATFFTPANLSSLPNVIAVGGTTLDDLRKPDSNFGSDVTISAPAEFVFSPTFFQEPFDLNDYDSNFSGTSASTPMVTGVAGILKAIKPELTPGEIKDILIKSADSLFVSATSSEAGKSLGSGCSGIPPAGQVLRGCRLNAFKAVCKILDCKLASPLIANLPLGHIATVAGIGPTRGFGVGGFSGDGGPAKSAQLNQPSGIALDKIGNLFISDTFNNRIRFIDAESGIITTIAGTGIRSAGPNGIPAILTQLDLPGRIALDKIGNFFIVFTEVVHVREINTTTGIINITAGTFGGFGGDGGPATLAQLAGVADVKVDNAGNIFIADVGNQRVRRIDAVTGIITTVAGTGEAGFNGDGIPATLAKLNFPNTIGFDEDNNLFIADVINRRVRRVDKLTGIITTVVGTGVAGLSGDGGPAIEAQLLSPASIVLDKNGNIFILDFSVVRKVDIKTGIINRIVGTSLSGFSGDNGPAILAQLFNPTNIALDGAGNLFISDAGNHRIRAVRLAP